MSLTIRRARAADEATTAFFNEAADPALFHVATVNINEENEISQEDVNAILNGLHPLLHPVLRSCKERGG